MILIIWQHSFTPTASGFIKLTFDCEPISRFATSKNSESEIRPEFGKAVDFQAHIADSPQTMSEISNQPTVSGARRNDPLASVTRRLIFVPGPRSRNRSGVEHTVLP